VKWFGEFISFKSNLVSLVIGELIRLFITTSLCSLQVGHFYRDKYVQIHSKSNEQIVNLDAYWCNVCSTLVSSMILHLVLFISSHVHNFIWYQNNFFFALFFCMHGVKIFYFHVLCLELDLDLIYHAFCLFKKTFYLHSFYAMWQQQNTNLVRGCSLALKRETNLRNPIWD